MTPENYLDKANIRRAEAKDANQKMLFVYVDCFIKDQFYYYGFVKDSILLLQSNKKQKCYYDCLAYFIPNVGFYNVIDVLVWVDLAYLEQEFHGFKFSIVDRRWFFNLLGSIELVITEK